MGHRAQESVIERLRVIENNLTPLVIVAAAAGLLLGGGCALSDAVTPMLALLMLTFDLGTPRPDFR